MTKDFVTLSPHVLYYRITSKEVNLVYTLTQTISFPNQLTGQKGRGRVETELGLKNVPPSFRSDFL